MVVLVILTWNNWMTQKTCKVGIWIAFIWLYLCSQPFFSYWLVSAVEDDVKPVLIDDNAWQSADAIWVLACTHFNKPKVPEVSKWNNCALQRLVHAFQMFNKHPLPIILTGGVFGDDESFTYASKAKTFLISLGVPEDKLIAIDVGKNTKTELIALMNSTEFKAVHRLAVVSSASHGRRISTLLVNNDYRNFIFVPVEHLNLTVQIFGFGLPSLHSLEKSKRAIYTFMANAELNFD
jgi:uncharacterized SAM-binding protein YcdF (DUF218 family)